MKKKEDVYVVVDSREKAKKLKRVLDMFGERTYSKSSIQDCLYNTENVLGFDEDENAFMSVYVHQFESSRTKVSIKDLRNILAKEHLKAGDVCLFEDDGGKYLGVFDRLSTCFDGQYRVSEYLINGVNNGCGIIKNFIRYATEEEKALLEPKKELEVGKWYRTKRALFNHQNGYDSYGFLDNKWVPDNWKTNLYDFVGVTPVQATPKEVEQALIEEAKRRYKVGDKLSLFNDYGYVGGNGIYSGDFDDLSFCIDSNTLAVKTTNGFYQMVFNNGQWATVIEKGKFTDSDVAIVERLHDTLLENHGYSLGSKLLTDARILANKLKNK